jgi:hypothetical protein
MECTITQSGALYGMQRRATKRYLGARQKRVITNKIIRTDELLPESLRFLPHLVGNDLESPWSKSHSMLELMLSRFEAARTQTVSTHGIY